MSLSDELSRHGIPSQTAKRKTPLWRGPETGVYAIVNLVNGKVYIGSSSHNVIKRWCSHRSKLRRGIHPNNHLQRAWNRYSGHNFNLVVLEWCDPGDCLKREQHYLDVYEPFRREQGYNKSKLATSGFGAERSIETRKKISEAKKGCKLSVESIRRRTIKQTGLKRSPETKARMSEAAKKRGISPETREKIKLTMKTPEYRAKMAAHQTGKKASIQTLANMSAAQKRRFARSEERLKVSIWMQGNQNRKRGGCYVING